MPDDDLFMAEMADVQPLKGDKLQPDIQYQTDAAKAEHRKTQSILNGYYDLMTLDVQELDIIAPEDVVSHKRQGIQQAAFRRMIAGEYPIKAELNLVGLQHRQAREALVNFILKSQSLGLRNVIVIHGKGANSKPFPGVMKSLVINWLHKMPEVMAFHSAVKHQGGSGAMYLMLAKSEEMKLESKETNHKGVGFR